MPTRSCVYASASQGVHDERWIDALRRCVDIVHVLSVGHNVANLDELRQQVAELHPDVVVAGPLDSITRHLVGVGPPLIGLSWGYDLHQLSEEADLAWLPSLTGLLVDTRAGFDLAYAAGVPAVAITVLPWGVDIRACDPSGERAVMPTPADAWVVLSARAHESLYRVADIIEGFAMFADHAPDAHLVIANDGSLTADLQQLAKTTSYAERIHFIGRLTEAQMPSLLRASHCYVTMSEIDGTSVTLLQAMACGTPVIASRNPGNLEWVVDNRTGKLVNDVDDLRRVLQEQYELADPRLVTAARTKVQKHADWHANRARLQTAIDAAVSD